MSRRTWFCCLIGTLLAALGLYGAAVIPYHPPWNDPEGAPAMNAPTTALRVLVNQPEAAVRASFAFNQFPEPDALTAWADITFLNVPDPPTFRWALVGTGRMRFESKAVVVPAGAAVPDHFAALPPFQDAYKLVAPQSWSPTDASSCDPRFATLGASSVIYGGLSYGTQLETHGWFQIAAQNLSAKLVFPEVVADTDLTSVKWTIGTIGDTSRTADVGTLQISVGDCVAVLGEELRPPKQPIDMDVKLAPGSKAKGYKLVEATPASTDSLDEANWRTSEPLSVSATFQSEKMVKWRDALIWSAGIVGGIFASLLLVGVTVAARKSR
ncbi:hypothetical protein DAVIS_04836 [Mycobacterium marinum]|uniref:Uncharacterized protein n=1 Tax=Mycobacterium marinum TaxID=1781 RepID=A0A3E2MPM9_MYCMR|nr:hypothetical protein [Mycobacterium marinum]RFZ34007.1 hypothetical protein DAVIS_04836 [Mycobacterium marinum]